MPRRWLKAKTFGCDHKSVSDPTLASAVVCAVVKDAQNSREARCEIEKIHRDRQRERERARETTAEMRDEGLSLKPRSE